MDRSVPERVTAWARIDQPHVDAFAQATLDRDPMHTDVDWARNEGPFGTTVLFGAQSLALLVYFAHQLGDALPPESVALNYGYDRVRFVEPVPVGSRLRARFTERGREPKNGGELVRLDVVLEIEGHTRPALTAQWLWLAIPVAAARRA